MTLFAKIINLVYDKGGLMGEWTKPLTFSLRYSFKRIKSDLLIGIYDYYK